MSRSRVVIVTGAGRGIGAATALALARPDTVLALCQRNAAGLSAVEDAARERGAAVRTYSVDVRYRDRVAAVVQDLVEREGGIDVLVNNAGIICRRSVAETDEEEWDSVFDTNVKGVLWFTQAVAEPMTRQGRGAIVNVSSIAGRYGNAERAAYCASKAAVDALTKVSALELGPHGVRVNAVAPGFIRTEINDVELREQQLEAAFAERIPLGRIGDVDEVAGAVSLLASPEASYINGEVLVVDGGWTIAQNFPKAQEATR
ncbi:SDR family NAD(P)-dependent oxidoreductase [Microbacterium soli]|uniref:Ketoreductase domain-containing protein n=1 Tax=Microbacterium soli TaxID=446075 RepID=A0ABP7MXS1_9MICO